MKVLALGVSRSGTESLSVALSDLGFGPVYHGWRPLLEHPEDLDVWKDLVPTTLGPRRTLTREDFDRVLAGFEAVTDAPCCFMPYELMKAYPEAKIIINTREFDAWNKSFQATLTASYASWPLYLAYQLHPVGRRMLRVLAQGTFFFWQGDLYNTRRRHEEHSALILGLALKDKRPVLEWQPQDGWAPLCEFLDMPVPDHAFPFGNQTAVFQERVRAKTADLLMDQLKWCGSALIVSVAVGVGSWLAWSRA